MAVVAVVYALVTRNKSTVEQIKPVSTPTTVAAEKVEEPELSALSNVELVKMSWYKTSFGSIMMATFAIRNNNDVAVKDVEIECSHSAASGTRIDSNTRTIYQIIPAHTTKTFRDFNMGFIQPQVAGTRCDITKVALEDPLALPDSKEARMQVAEGLQTILRKNHPDTAHNVRVNGRVLIIEDNSLALDEETSKPNPATWRYLCEWGFRTVRVYRVGASSLSASIPVDCREPKNESR